MGASQNKATLSVEEEKLRVIREQEAVEQENRQQLSLWERYNDQVTSGFKEAIKEIKEKHKQGIEVVEGGFMREVLTVSVKREEIRQRYEGIIAKERQESLDPDKIRLDVVSQAGASKKWSREIVESQVSQVKNKIACILSNFK